MYIPYILVEYMYASLEYHGEIYFLLYPLLFEILYETGQNHQPLFPLARVYHRVPEGYFGCWCQNPRGYGPGRRKGVCISSCKLRRRYYCQKNGVLRSIIRMV